MYIIAINEFNNPGSFIFLRIWNFQCMSFYNRTFSGFSITEFKYLQWFIDTKAVLYRPTKAFLLFFNVAMCTEENLFTIHRFLTKYGMPFFICCITIEKEYLRLGIQGKIFILLPINTECKIGFSKRVSLHVRWAFNFSPEYRGIWLEKYMFP